MNGFDKKLRNVLGMARPSADGVFIELRGRYRLIAEGIDELLEYGDTRMVLGAKADRIAVMGENLEMRFLSENRIVIEGNIQSVQYI